ncbi:hypothetical protein WJT74_04650 [Sphingomicrobium sp. XHP0239]|uniref:hypothetical protein n=1 Tax=Sphingomicrobium maritimum TaxID=3133972 RepID=UPI0031CCAAEA
MPPLATAALSFAMVAAFLLGAVGLSQVRKPDRQTRQRGWLMVAMAIILVANVLIWTV